VPILALAVTVNNFHALLQCHDLRPKRALGAAKTHVTFRFAPILDTATRQRRTIWEGEGGVRPIRNRVHGIVAFHYILDHVKQGAWVWSFRDTRRDAT